MFLTLLQVLLIYQACHLSSCDFCMASSTDCRNKDITPLGSSLPTTAVPDTIIFAPAWVGKNTKYQQPLIIFFFTKKENCYNKTEDQLLGVSVNSHILNDSILFSVSRLHIQQHYQKFKEMLSARKQLNDRKEVTKNQIIKHIYKTVTHTECIS